MKIYNYHPVTREYISEGEARPDPVTIGEFLIPANATQVTPPMPTLGKARVFDGTWSQVEDHRGETFWNMTTLKSLVVEVLGSLPAGWTELPMPDNESKWNGSAWVPDTDKINARLAEEARIAAKAQAILDNLPSWAAVDAAVTNIANLADAKAFIRKLARVVYWLAKNQAD